MHLTETDTGHALLTTIVPPAVDEGDIQLALVTRLLITVAYQVGEAVILRTATVAFATGRKEVAEAAPGDTDVISSDTDVQIAVDAILEVAVVDPDVGTALQIQVVVAIEVASSRTLEGDVADGDVVALTDEQDARLLDFRILVTLAGGDVLIHILKRSTGQSDDGLVLHTTHLVLSVEGDGSFDVDNGLRRTKST